MSPADEHPGSARRFDVMIGTGGIGWGRFFALSGNGTLGREESRMGRFLDRRDYCKLHIISHYVKAILGDCFRVVPIGKVGSDEAGTRLLEQMREARLDMRYVEVAPGKPTLYCVCLLYPDGSGGNLTVEDSASAAVDIAAIRRAEADFTRAKDRGIALAAPEVPLEARRELLNLATRHGLFRVASFVAGEMRAARESGILTMADLLSVNAGEAAALCDLPEDSDPADLAGRATDVLRSHNPAALMTMTAGAGGSWMWDGQAMHYQPAWKVPHEPAHGHAGPVPLPAW